MKRRRHTIFIPRLHNNVFFLCPSSLSRNSDVSHEWDPDSLYRCHHEPVTRQRFPPFWVLFLGGQSGARLQHYLHYWTLPDQPPVWWTWNIRWWVKCKCKCKIYTRDYLFNQAVVLICKCVYPSMYLAVLSTPYIHITCHSTHSWPQFHKYPDVRA